MFVQRLRRLIQPLPATQELAHLPDHDVAILNPDQLAELARQIASEHHVVQRSGNVRQLEAVLTRDTEVITAAHAVLLADSQQRRMVTPAAEWLLDNYHLVVDQIREIRRDLPRGYYAELPKLADGPFTNTPRVYAIARTLIRHTDSRIDLVGLLRFTSDYQTVAPLSMGELWALASMLRLGLVEKLARLCSQLLAARATRTEADRWAERLLTEPPRSSVLLNPVLAELAQSQPELSAVFGAQLLQRLRSYDGDHDVGALITWLEHQPIVPYQRIEALLHADHQNQASMQAAIGNTITSLRTLNTIDWPSWFEQVSLAEHLLRQDPAGAYANSTPATRDSYRHALEQLARGSGMSELAVARLLLDQARQAATVGEPRAMHVGYGLIDAGRPALEAAIGYRPTRLHSIQRAIRRRPTLSYLGSLALGTAAWIALGQRLVAGQRKPLRLEQAAMVGLLALPASAIAKELVDRAVALVLPPRRLPRLDMRAGIPPDYRTMVVVPTLLLTEASVRGQLENLEILALANQDACLHFALLSDWADAPAACMPGDQALLELATQGIMQLNVRYGSDRFLLFHRQRVWNAQQGCYMGWERKRGKLEEFNKLLEGAQATTFTTLIGDQSLLPYVRYVITLDADTQLPRDTARALIGTLAHPLNQAVIDPHTNRVIDGYGILQPRVGITLPSALRSHFTRLFSGNVGIDPYTTAVSDVYMDLSGEGIYAGKGIYDPQALRLSLAERFPENALLSHDLIEGSYARVGLLSDLELLDSYPATYASYTARQHRWVRGDWQIAGWVLPWVPSANGMVPNILPLMARYKIFDNLRRSVLPAGMLALLAHAWLRAENRRSALALTGYTALPMLLPVVFDALTALQALVHGPERQQVLSAQADHLRLTLLRAVVNIAVVPDQAFTNLDAIIRTLTRLLFTHRNLLEWETSAAVQSRLTHSWRAMLGRMTPLFGGAGLGALLFRNTIRQTWPAAVPLLADWVAAPALVAWLDQPAIPTPEPVTENDRLLLRRLARTTWAFFEQFVTAESHFLAPDNFQETPVPLVAMRTSPTNIGLQLLADLAAYDMGYIGVVELTERVERVFTTIAQLRHERGHLLNWYTTDTLQELPPAYISTVDSGNLAGALLVLRQGFLQLGMRPWYGQHILHGLQDTLALIEAGQPSARQQSTAMRELLATQPGDPQGYRRLLETIVASNPEATGNLGTLTGQARSFLRDYAAFEAHAEPLLLKQRQQAIAAQAFEWVQAMDFAFLYDQRRKLFMIGYSLAEGRHDNSYYDLLASEARLASFLAIAKGDVPQEHWFQLGRALLDSGAGPVLASWSGTMFEYLMPLLLMHTFPQTLLDTSYQVAVSRQIQYGQERQIPWGVSESAYNARDPAMNYQYRAFGVPGLGLKRGLAGDMVVAPYASVLALAIQPHAAVANLHAFVEQGMLGQYGLYEAVDYTTERIPPGSAYSLIRSYMVHHQAMSMLAMVNLLHANPMPQRFHAEPIVQATESLLQERILPGGVQFQPPEVAQELVSAAPLELVTRTVTTPTTAFPITHVLSNGSYSVMVTNAGGGFSSYESLAVTRWQSDPARDQAGSFLYLRDARSGLAWSATYQPTRHVPHEYRVIFGLDKVTYVQHYAGIESQLEITVSPEDPVEVRRLTLINLTSAPRELEITSYTELVLTSRAADAAHPAFSNLFIETEYLPEQEAVLATRRPRASDAEQIWAMQVTAVRGHTSGSTEYDTDRARFIGRGRSLANPQALQQPLSQQSGAVLDPILSMRRRVRIAPGATVQVTFATGVAPDREQALRLANRYCDPDSAARAFSMAWTSSQIELRQLAITASDAQRFQRLAASIFYLDPLRRGRTELLAQNSRGQSGLWGFGISGDDPIILVRVTSSSDLALVQELLQAHQYWRFKRLKVDLVILNDDGAGYLQAASDQIMALVRRSGSSAWLNQRGGVYLVRTDLLDQPALTLLHTVARAVLSTDRGGLAQHLRRRDQEPTPMPPALPGDPDTSQPLPALHLHDQNAYGGFADDGSYVIDLQPGLAPPAPWSNVIANQQAGFLITDQGGGYTWVGNSRENRLTPWSNDPVLDPPGEVVYLSDPEQHLLWSATPQPAGPGYVRVIHAPGVSRFIQQRHGIQTELSLAMPPDDPLKLFRLHIQNSDSRPRTLRITLYVAWVLGVLRDQMAPYVITAFDQQHEILLAHNPYHPEYPEQQAFLACSEPVCGYSGDRVAFLGRNGDHSRPLALVAGELNGRIGAGIDPCGVVQCELLLEAGQEHEIVFVLGQAASIEQATSLVQQYRSVSNARNAEYTALQYWQDVLGQLRVATPLPQFDRLLNGWLLYQTLVCRLWARAAFYQSGGAYGFRDQLQDVLALLHAAPAQAHAQILRAASRQFLEGDVQHWWHPPLGRGVRTNFSDDYLWLPFVTTEYVTVTGDCSILDQSLPFIQGRPLASGEHEYYDLPTITPQQASLYEHCLRAVERALGRMGTHGLPLMGTGDWNDGMNRVGELGRGESVWVGWFLIVVLQRMAALAHKRSEPGRAERYLAEAQRLTSAIDQHAWDGRWYLRAFFDDGTALGSASSAECQIDSLSQSWAVIAGSADPARARLAMQAVIERLVDPEQRLIKLFTPPFDQSEQDPGYIKGYVPGVRENGGQYTHAALWVIWATTLLGDGTSATRLFELINPIGIASSNLERYMVEPYVVAADVYAGEQHAGRGGWTWYTGSASWMYRLGIEQILGLKRTGATLTITPCIPADWPGFEAWYRYGTSCYHITVQRCGPTGQRSIMRDTVMLEGTSIPLDDDGQEHSILVVW